MRTVRLRNDGSFDRPGGGTPGRSSSPGLLRRNIPSHPSPQVRRPSLPRRSAGEAKGGGQRGQSRAGWVGRAGRLRPVGRRRSAGASRPNRFAADDVRRGPHAPTSPSPGRRRRSMPPGRTETGGVAARASRASPANGTPRCPSSGTPPTLLPPAVRPAVRGCGGRAACGPTGRPGWSSPAWGRSLRWASATTTSSPASATDWAAWTPRTPAKRGTRAARSARTAGWWRACGSSPRTGTSPARGSTSRR